MSFFFNYSNQSQRPHSWLQVDDGVNLSPTLLMKMDDDIFRHESPLHTTESCVTVGEEKASPHACSLTLPCWGGVKGARRLHKWFYKFGLWFVGARPPFAALFSGYSHYKSES